MGQHEDTGEALHSLQGKGTLLLQFLPPALTAIEQFRIPRLSLGESALRPGDLLLHLRRSPADLLVRPLEKLRERKLHVSQDAFDFGEPVSAVLFQERRQRVFVEPRRHFGKLCNLRQTVRYFARCEIPEQAQILETWISVFQDLDCEQTLVDDLAEAIDNPRPVQVDARGILMLERVERSAFPEYVEGPSVGVAPHCFK